MDAPRVALVGAPNTGKSTLFNRLIGRRKALVHREPGMTRDLNEEECQLAGRRVRLVDTGGLFPPGREELAGKVRRLVMAEASRCAALIFLVDGSRGLAPLDEELASLFRKTGRPVILAVNKIDVPRHEARLPEFYRLGLDPMIPISAEHGSGVEELEAALEGLLPVEPSSGPSAEPEEPSPPVKLAIAGRPNVGKSTLFNALLGQERAIVSDRPGTTRDAIDTLLRVGDRVYRILDTAGLRRQGHIVHGAESLSAMAARRGIEQSHIALIVMDATEAPTMQDLHVAGVAHRAFRPFIVLLNKWDLLDGAESQELIALVRERLKFAPWAPVLTISARSGLRVGRILATVDRVSAQAGKRLSTSALNRWLGEAIVSHAPPSVSGRELKLQYITQTEGCPPSFLLFTNREGAPHFSYRRYLENSLRERFGLDLTPIALKYRRKPRAAGDSRGTSVRPR